MLHDLTLVLKFSRPNRGFSRPKPRGFSTRPSGFSKGEAPSEAMSSAGLCCNQHISLDSFRQALQTNENFSTFHFVCELMAENRHYSYE